MATTGHEAVTSFSWSAHPFRERPGRALLGCVWITAFVLMVYATMGSAGWAWLAGVVLVGSLHRFFFPSRYDVDEGGITGRSLLGTQRMRWREVRRFVWDENGGYLSAHARASRLDAYRGMHLLFGEKRETVIGRIEACLDAAGTAAVRRGDLAAWGKAGIDEVRDEVVSGSRPSMANDAVERGSA